MSTSTTPDTGSDLLVVRDLTKHFPIRKGLLQRQVGAVQAVDDVTFSVRRGETLSLVGESGCGKTTTGRMITRLIEPTGGQVLLDGRDITHLSAGKLRPLRRDVQMIFQDPYGSLNPRHTVGTIVGTPYRLQKIATPNGVKRAVRTPSSWSACPRSTTTATRTGSAAVSGSASASPGRWPSSPSSSSLTSRSRRWTCRSRPRSSTSSRTCSPSSASPT